MKKRVTKAIPKQHIEAERKVTERKRKLARSYSVRPGSQYLPKGWH